MAFTERQLVHVIRVCGLNSSSPTHSKAGKREKEHCKSSVNQKYDEDERQ